MSRCRLSYVLQLLKEQNIKPKKNLSQNFLVDHNIAEKIVSRLNLAEGDHVLEIGPGLGALTEKLLAQPIHLSCIEKDQDMVQLLPTAWQAARSFQIYHQDFMLFQLQCPAELKRWKVVSNLPYHLTSKILKNLAKARSTCSLAVVMVEKGYAVDLLRMHEEKSHDATSFILHYAFEPEIAFTVSNSCFYPKPSIDSAVMILKPKPVEEDDLLFIQFIEILFGHKRKMIQSLLKSSFDIGELPQHPDLTPLYSLRAETLSVEMAKCLFHHLKEPIKTRVEEQEAKRKRYTMRAEPLPEF